MAAEIPIRSVSKLPMTIHTRNWPRKPEMGEHLFCGIPYSPPTSLISTHHNQADSVLFLGAVGSYDGDNQGEAAHGVQDNETNRVLSDLEAEQTTARQTGRFPVLCRANVAAVLTCSAPWLLIITWHISVSPMKSAPTI